MGNSGFARFNVVLSFVGLYIAGMLSMSHLMGIQLPCGTGSGCGLVTNDRRSFLLGIPIAYYGLAAYLGFVILSTARLLAQRRGGVSLHRVGYLSSFLGVLVSIGLTLYSTRVLHAVCAWCIGSAITMSLLLMSHALEAGTPRGPFVRPTRSDRFLILLLAGLVGGGLAYSAKGLERGVPIDRITRKPAAEAPHLGLSDEELMPASVHIQGPSDAKTILVMFGDLTCPVCQDAFGRLTELLKRRHDFRFAFRHLPLRMHPLARPAALLSELAAEKGKFWEFARDVYASDTESEAGLRKLLEPYGVPASEARRRTANLNDSVFGQLALDDAETEKLKLDTTPTLYLVADGFYPARTSAAALEAMLDDVAKQRR